MNRKFKREMMRGFFQLEHLLIINLPVERERNRLFKQLARPKRKSHLNEIISRIYLTIWPIHNNYIFPYHYRNEHI